MQQGCEMFAEFGVVFDHTDSNRSRFHLPFDRWLRGIRNWTWVPRRSELARLNLPPMDSMRDLMLARPRPAELIRSGSKPRPLSSIATSSQDSAVVQRTDTSVAPE